MKGIKINHYTAKEAMLLAVDYMKLETIQIIERITAETLKYYQTNAMREEIHFDIAFAEDRAVAETLGIRDERILKEAETQLFTKLLMQYLHKNRVKVFLLSENEDSIADMKKYLAENWSKIRIVETATMETHGISDDMILNRINGVEADCIIAALQTPLQQEFIARNRMLMDAKLWIGLGTGFFKSKKTRLLSDKKIFAGIKKFFGNIIAEA